MFKKFARICVKILPKPLQKLYYRYEEALMYLFFGVLTTVVSFLAAGLSKWALEQMQAGSGTVSIVSTVFSWICAVTFAYVTNRLWVFDSKVSGFSAIFREAVSFYGGRAFTLAAETVMMWLGYSVIGINYWITKIGANVIVLILNYVISKLFVFKDTKEEQNEQA